MKFFDFGTFQSKMQMPSHDKIIFHMLFGALHVIPRTYIGGGWGCILSCFGCIWSQISWFLNFWNSRNSFFLDRVEFDRHVRCWQWTYDAIRCLKPKFITWFKTEILTKNGWSQTKFLKMRGRKIKISFLGQFLTLKNMVINFSEIRFFRFFRI